MFPCTQVDDPAGIGYDLNDVFSSTQLAAGVGAELGGRDKKRKKSASADSSSDGDEESQHAEEEGGEEDESEGDEEEESESEEDEVDAEDGLGAVGESWELDEEEAGAQPVSKRSRTAKVASKGVVLVCYICKATSDEVLMA